MSISFLLLLTGIIKAQTETSSTPVFDRLELSHTTLFVFDNSDDWFFANQSFFRGSGLQTNVGYSMTPSFGMGIFGRISVIDQFNQPAFGGYLEGRMQRKNARFFANLALGRMRNLERFYSDSDWRTITTKRNILVEPSIGYEVDLGSRHLRFGLGYSIHYLNYLDERNGGTWSSDIKQTKRRLLFSVGFRW